MSEETQRRLAAILAADVVGYSRLMEADEAGTLATMKAHRAELWGPMTERHGGRVVGAAGDSLLVEFASAVAAVDCAVAVQRGMIDRNLTLPEAMMHFEGTVSFPNALYLKPDHWRASREETHVHRCVGDIGDHFGVQ